MCSKESYPIEEVEEYPKRRIRSFMRRQGRMSAAQQSALADHWQMFGLESQQAPYNFALIFKRAAPLYLEIGFGMGNSLLEQAKKFPQYDFIGIEVHTPGIGKVLAEIAALELTNLRVINADAVEILKQSIPDQSLYAIQIFFPDPWPKRKHHKRRLIQTEFIELLMQKLQPSGFIHLATDWEDYAAHMFTVLSGIPGLQNTTEQSQARISERPLTKFEQRGTRLGYKIWDYIFVKM